MIGETVKVRIAHEIDRDPFNQAITTATEETVEDVLVEPGDLQDLGTDHPEGVQVLYRLHFPKTFNENLEGQKVEVRGEWLDVIGHPDHYMPENTPTRWWMKVEVGSTHG